MENIKEVLDRTGEYIYDYKSEGYYCWLLIFEKKDKIYSVTYHLSTESGREDDLDYFESEDFNKVMEYTKENFNVQRW